MKTTRFTLLFLAWITCMSIAVSQKTSEFSCGFDHLRTPAREAQMQRFEELLQQYQSTRKGASLPESLSGLPYVIPVVVHVIHNNGTENIPDAQIIAAIDHLNQGFSGQGYFAQFGATFDTRIQFCLAQRDPAGNATNGITRTQSALTEMEMETQDSDLKSLIQWNPLDYVNIWVVREISSQSFGPNVAGYAYFPGAHGEPEDGIVCETKFFGADPSEDAVLIHEMGHYLGLYHTFQNGCSNDDCQLQGDRVCDTPPDNATHTNCPYNSCSTDIAPGSPFTADVDDFTGDFMDYSPFFCYRFFTAGQAVRMQTALETARASLLESRACQPWCAQPVNAAFTPSPNPAQAGQVVTFTNNSTGGNTWSWLENGVEFSQLQQPTRVFNVPGIYTITLNAGNGSPYCDNSAKTNLVVECPLEVLFNNTVSTVSKGETIAFTNQTTGTGPITYEWLVNGQPVSIAQDFSYMFQQAGFFTITLNASGPFCSKSYAVVIIVTEPCGQTLSVITNYTSGQGSFLTQDIATIPDGSLIHCGAHNNKPAVTRFDAAGNVLWHVVTSDAGGFYDIEPMPNGEFLLLGEAASRFLVAKIDINGNFSWYKTLNLTNNFKNEQGADIAAVSPDGSIGVFAKNGIADSYLIKIAPDGSIVWSKKLPTVITIGGLRIAADGSGDFLLSSSGNSLGDIGVFRIDQNGQLVQAVVYDFPTETINGQSYKDLSVHPEDGGYSVFFNGIHILSDLGYKRLVRCAADGSVLWAKRFVASSNLFSRFNTYIRHLPDQRGWLVADYLASPGFLATSNYLTHYSENGEPLWHRYFGSLPNEDKILAAEYQDGLVKAIAESADKTALQLLKLPDSNAPVDCLPAGALEELAIPIDVVAHYTTIPLQVANLVLSDWPMNLSPSFIITTPSCATALPCPEICDNQIDDDQDGYLDCFDSDCDCSFDGQCIIPDGQQVTIGAQLDWESASTPMFVYATPKVANLDPQRGPMPEIICPGSLNNSLTNINRLYFFQGDGSNQSSPRKLDIPQALGGGNSTAIGDLDDDGIPELVVVCRDELVRVYKNYDPAAADAMQLWLTSDLPCGATYASPSLADFNADGVPEIYVGNAVYKLNLSGTPQLIRAVKSPFGPFGRNSYASISAVTTAADLLSPADCNGDPDCGGLELAAGFEIYSIDLNPNDGDGYQIKTQRTLQTLAPAYFWQDGLTAVADMDLDGTPDVVVTGGRDFVDYGAYIWNKNGLVRFMPFFFPGGTDYEPNGNMPCIANVYDDRKNGAAQDFPELIATSARQIYAMNLNAADMSPANPSWWSTATSDESGYCSATTFDLNGDGTLEIIYRDQSELRIMYGGKGPFPPGVNSQRNWAALPVASGTREEYPVVADVDNDGIAEIAVTGAGSLPAVFGRLKIFEHVGAPWRPCRSIWNQDNYHVTNINDDLSVPAMMQKHWLEFPAAGSGSWPINNYLSQRSSLSELTSLTNGQPVPDASLTVDSVRCQADSFAVFVSICNVGSSDLPIQTPLAFYNGNPATTASTLLFPPILLPQAIQKDSCLQFSITVPAAYNQAVYMVVNDDGSTPSPFSLGGTELSTSQFECRFDNNLAVFNLQHQSPALDLGPDVELCKNSVLELVADAGFDRYRWQDGTPDSSFTAYTEGTFWVDAYDACGLKQSDTIRITLNQTATLNLPDELAVCPGEQAQLSATGFTSYSWAPADSVSCADCADITFVANSSITIYLTAADGVCFVSDSVQVMITPGPDLDFVVQDGDCDSPAQITATATGMAPFVYAWSPSGAGPVLTVTEAGVYTVTISDAAGCTAVDSASVNIGSSLIATSNLTAPGCAGATTGAIDLTVNGGVQPWQFLWSNNAVTEDISGLPAGVFTVTITDANSCTLTLELTLDAPQGINLLAQVTDPLCTGESSGSIDLSVQGGSGNLGYSWSNIALTEDQSNLPAGIYTVTVTDANGCTQIASVTLTDPPALQSSLQIVNPACTGESTGSLDLSVVGGSGNLGYAWSTSGTLEDLDDLPAGVYTVTVTDANGCTLSASASLTDPPVLSAALVVVNPLCAGDPTGSLDVTISGGSGNLTFLWSNAGAAEDLLNVPAGIYSLVVTDGNGCTSGVSATLEDPPAMALSVQTIHPACAGNATGAIDLTVTGSNGSPTFAWSNNSALEDLADVPAGVYLVTATDANGCTAVISATLTDPPGITLSAQAVDPACAAEPGGAIDLNLSGGAGNAVFLWSNNSMQEDLNGLPAGLYTVTCTDASGCTRSLTVTLVDPPVLVLDAAVVQPVCHGDSNGAIDLTAGGGTGQLVFNWSNSSTDEDLFDLGPGAYNVVVADANGCTAQISETLLDPLPLVLTAQTTNPACAGAASGAIDLTVTGGAGAWSFSWSNAAATEDLQLVTAGVYTVVVSDANGCTDQITTTLLDPPALLLDLQNEVQNCPGDTVALQLTSNGGVPPLLFNWSNGAATPTIAVTLAGVYTVTVQDFNGCTSTASSQVSTLSAPPVIQLTAGVISCANPSATIAATANAPGVTFVWSGENGFGSGTPAPEVNAAGTYTVVATEPVGGCRAQGVIQVSADTVAPHINLSATTWEIPCGQDTATISAAGSSSGPDFEVQWTSSAGGLIQSGAQTLMPIVDGGGVYTLTINDLSNGCTAVASVDVLESESMTAVVVADSVRCFGESNGGIRVTAVVGGTAPLRYRLDGQSFQPDSVFEGLTAGVYQLEIADANGCTLVQSVQVAQPDDFEVNLTGDSLLVAGETAFLQALASPADFVPVQIAWKANEQIVPGEDQLDLSLQVLQNTLFQITLYNQQGCAASDTRLVLVDQANYVYTPNAISPESASQENRSFVIFAGPTVQEIAFLGIFDRWGDQVFYNEHFQPNDAAAGWDGTFRGSQVPPGVFVWVAKVVYKDGSTEVLKGDLTVLR